MTAIKMKIEMEVELDSDLWELKEQPERDWFENDVMKVENLYLHSNEVGDEIGKVTALKIISID